MAELETLVVVVLCHANGVINSSAAAVGDLRPSLRPLAAHRELLSLAALGDAGKIWRQREFVTSLDTSTEACALPVNGQGGREPQPPLDGRTLKPHHLQRVAAVYGISTASLIQTQETLSLKKLSDARNDIAHGNLPFHGVFSRQGFLPAEVRRDLDAFDRIGYNLVATFDGYLDRADYLA